jgi:hypothetical protein
MFKLFAFFLFCYLTLIVVSSKVEVDYDELRDMIIMNGKIYSAEPVHAQPVPVSGHHETKTGEHEELAEGAQFWFYIFMIVCKF